jgi:hypothetical protein
MPISSRRACELADSYEGGPPRKCGRGPLSAPNRAPWLTALALQGRLLQAVPSRGILGTGALRRARGAAARRRAQVGGA